MTPEELEDLKQIILDPDQEEKLKLQIEEHWNQLSVVPSSAIEEDKLEEIFNQVVEHPQSSQRKTIGLWHRIASVSTAWKIASAIAVVTLGIWLYYGQPALNWFQYRPDTILSSRVSRDLQDIKPGSVGATLILANGKTIKLANVSDSTIASEAGVTITKSADGQLIYNLSFKDTARDLDPTAIGMTNTLFTAKGETYRVKLPDGSKVWLNAASSLTYSANLVQNGQRRVKLTGEAYLEVAKDNTHPFIVESEGQQVEVLGTHFNINSYADEGSIKTTLLEGSVKVSQNDGRQSTLILRPGQQSVIKGSNRIKVEEVDVNEAVLWKEGKFSFDREEIGSIMKKVERWYDVEVSYKDDVRSVKLTGSVSRFENVSKLLSMLENTREVHFKIEGKKIIVSK